MPQKSLHFSISERKLYLRIFDVLFSLLGLFVINYFFDFQYFNFYSTQKIIWIIILAFYLLFFGQVFEMYNLKVASDKYLTLRSTLITVALTTIFYVFTPVITPELPQNRLQIVFFAFALLVFILLNRFIYIQFIFSPRFFKNILVIGDANEIEKILQQLKYSGTNLRITYVSNKQIKSITNIEFIPLNDANLNLLVAKNFINEILVSSSNPALIDSNLSKQLIEIFEKGTAIKSLEKFLEEQTFKITENQLSTNFYNFFSFSKSHQNNLYLAFRRFLDFFFAILGFFFLGFLLPFVFAGNLVANRGALLYKQKRVGKRGFEFNIIKFRTMIANAEKNGAEWAKKNDVRVTPFGKLLRKTRLDEVPQFINVLKGEMSIIGPRPERPEFVSQLEKEIPFYAIRHVIKPGLTGWAQVMHPYASSVNDQQEKLMYDLYYIKERDLLLDFKIVIKTISTVLFFRGT